MGRVLRNQNGGNPDKMEKEGFVTRKIYSEDRRINRISLTTKADAAWNSLVDCSMQVRKSSIRDIPEEQVKIMLDVLEKISQNRLMTTASTIQRGKNKKRGSK
ncbi:MAG: hypothetical protein WAK17_11050 [Candidatus Nitrosopolaris sp.]